MVECRVDSSHSASLVQFVLGCLRLGYSQVSDAKWLYQSCPFCQPLPGDDVLVTAPNEVEQEEGQRVLTMHVSDALCACTRNRRKPLPRPPTSVSPSGARARSLAWIRSWPPAGAVRLRW
eukprot:1128004-Pleurochrysis_carterae.AAC.3